MYILKRLFLILIILLFSNLHLSGQETVYERPGALKRGISLQYATGGFAISYDFYLSKRFSYHVDASPVVLGAGIRYAYLDPTKKRIVPYTGLSFHQVGILDSQQPMLYFGTGAAFYGTRKFRFSASVGPVYDIKFDEISMWLALSAGYSFGKSISEPRATESISNKFIAYGLIGTFYLGYGLERVIQSRISLGAELGLIYVGLNARVYPFKLLERNLNLHLGYGYRYHYEFGFIDDGFFHAQYPHIGFTYIFENQYYAAFDIGPKIRIYADPGNYINEPKVAAQLRVGMML